MGDERASETRRAKEEAAAALRELEAERARHAATAKAKEATKAENEQLRKQCDEMTLKLEDVQAKLAEAEGGGEA